MALPKLYEQITWVNDMTPALNEDNLNAMSQALEDIDNRVIDVSSTVMETVPELEEMIEEVEQITQNPPYIGDNGDWYVWDTSINDYVDSGVDASITITVGTTSTLSPGSSATVTNTGTSTDPIFNFGIPKGDKGDTGNTGATPDITMTATADAISSSSPTVTVTKGGTAAAPTFALAFNGLKGAKGDTGATGNGIVSISKTGSVGRVDEYTITMDDGSHETFSVTNGAAGADGYSPVVTISPITGGHTVTITDKTHQSPGQSFNVMDGTGAGDMLASVYDSNGDVATAGGIVAYVASAINTAVTSALTASY